MFTTIKGVYANGIVILKEPAPVKSGEVLITFTEDTSTDIRTKPITQIADIFADCRVSLKNFIYNRNDANNYNE